MKHYAARRLESGRWAWTVQEGDAISQSGPCVLHGNGHTTKEEAERHFYDWDCQTLSQVKEERHGKSHDCEIPWCRVFTGRGMATKFHPDPLWLCSEHRFRHIYTMLRPFKAGVEVHQ